MRAIPPGFDVEAHTRRLESQGFTVIADYMTPEQLARFREGLEGHLGSYRGRNPFEGQIGRAHV